MKTPDKKSAFTLLELMLAILSSAIVTLACVAVLLIAIDAWKDDNIYVGLRRDAAFSMDMMARNIHESRPADLITAEQNKLELWNHVKNYKASFIRNPTTGILTYLEDGSVDVPQLAKRVDVFTVTPQTNNAVRIGVLLHLEMSGNDADTTIINETFVRMRN